MCKDLRSLDLSRVRRIGNFFVIHFEANLSKYGSYSLHLHVLVYSQTAFIHTLQNIRTNLYTNIQFDAKKIHIEAFSHTGKYLF